MASINYRAAKLVIAGEFGNGPERVARLTAAGFDAAEVQRLVNAILIDGYTEPEEMLTVEIDPDRYDGITLIIK